MSGSLLAQTTDQTTEQQIFAPVTEEAAPADPATDPAAGVQPQKPAKTQKTKQAQPAKQADQKQAKAAQAQAQSELDQRLGQIEEQIVDMQVVMGTLESMTRGGQGAAALPAVQGQALAPAVGGGDLDVRVGKLEAQLQGLSGQMAELAGQIRQLNVKLGGKTAAAQPAAAQPAADPSLGGFDTSIAPADGQVLQQPAAQPLAPANNTAAQAPAEGQISSEALSQVLDDGTGQAQAPAQPPADPNAGATLQTDPNGAQVASLTPSTPEQFYEDSYSRLLGHDYAGAEAGFTSFLQQFPKSKLAGNAQYWLGETYYVRGMYKEAADAFLQGYSKYKATAKAPDSLLKLAMSLSRLNEREQACNAFSALDQEFPNASAQVKRRATAERERTGC